MHVTIDSPTPLENHWALHPWTPGERKLAWHLTFARSQVLRDVFAAYAPAVDHPDLTPVPFEWAHMTLVSGTSTTTMPPCPLLQHAEPIPVAGVFLAREAPLLVPDGEVGWLQELWRHLVGPQAVAERGKLWEHVSLAYAHGPADPHELAQRLEAVDVEPFLLDGFDLTLMEIRQEDRCYRWDVLEQTPLT